MNKGANLLHMHQLLRHSAIENRSVDQINSNTYAVKSILADIAGNVDQLAKMDLAIFDGDEANKVSPGHDAPE